MKKLIALLLAIIMLAALSVSAIAATADNFTKSPSNTGAPEMTYDWTDPVSGCDPELTITPYKDRETKPEIKTAIEAAYDEIVHSQPSLRSLIITNGTLRGTNLMVSQLFDISFDDTAHTHTFGMNKTHNATIKLTGDEVKNFMYLLHYTYDTATPANSTWEIVNYTRTTEDTISFTVNSLSPFAIVVKNTTSEPTSPATGASASIACAVGAVVFGVAGVALLKKGKEN